MVFKHLNADAGAEADSFREVIDGFQSHVCSDSHDYDTNTTAIEYVNAEGDPPFIRYRLTLEPIAAYSEEQYAAIKNTPTPIKD